MRTRIWWFNYVGGLALSLFGFSEGVVNYTKAELSNEPIKLSQMEYTVNRNLEIRNTSRERAETGYAAGFIGTMLALASAGVIKSENN
jgi:hypothetical protein